MIGRTVPSIVKWIWCKIIIEISQRPKTPFRQFNRTHAFSVSYFNGKYVISY